MSGHGNSRRGDERRSDRYRPRSMSLHRPERTFEPPRDLSVPPSLLDFPNPDPMTTGELGAVRRPLLATGGLSDDRSGDRVIEPKSLPVAEPIDDHPHKRAGESWAQFESRLSMIELERFIQDKPRKSTMELEKLRDRQREEKEKRRKVFRKEDLVYPGEEEEKEIPPRPITPPGPPNRSKISADVSKRNERQSGTGNLRQGGDVGGGNRSRPLPTKTTGVMFNGLKPILTDPTVDPPPHVCQNCWLRGHRRQECPKKVTESCCYNCGRKYVTLINCPRCKEAHERFLEKKESSTISDRGKLEKARGRSQSGVDPSSSGPKIPEKSRHVAAVPILYDVTPRKPTVVSAEEKTEPPKKNTPSSSELVSTEEVPAMDLVSAIEQLTRMMTGLPVETINLAVRQLIEERRRTMDKM
ncbi:uncharacterized protein LOC127288574 [Leptopilina boulardi]|uniref:uncharacterized protein LOC127288574 n=1 Tax=Leptopilina boulardi TaxID=63433 RepID=UPI0021F50B57|nr:uncharacterized protein LOC127288574 [Leptopilina boulardi]